MPVGITKLANVLDPQVLADMLEAEITKQIRFAPLAVIDNTLEGQPGSTLTLPKWDYIGDAEDVAEGTAIPVTQLGQTTAQAKIKKAGKAVELTDESVLSGYGDPIGEAVRQIAVSIDQKVDNDFLTVLKGSTQSASIKGDLTVAGLQSAVDVLNEEDDTPTVLIVSPKRASQLRLDAGKSFLAGSELGANALVKGVLGEVDGVQVVRSKKLTDDEAFLVKQGALRLILKRDTLLEVDREVLKRTTVLAADKHYTAYLYKAEKVVKIGFTK